MAEFPYMPLWTDAYLGDTTHLTTVEHGAYMLLLMTMWRSPDCDLPDDDEMLTRYTRLSSRQWKKIRPILAPFFTIIDGKWKQKRLEKERKIVLKKSKRGKQNADTRWLKNKETGDAKASSQHMLNECYEDAIHNHSQIKEKEINKFISKKKKIIPQKTSPPKKYSDQFEEFWSRYPVNHTGKGSKAQASAKYESLTGKQEVSHAEIIHSLGRYERYVQSGRWSKSVYQWLKDRGWEDEWDIPAEIGGKRGKPDVLDQARKLLDEGW